MKRVLCCLLSVILITINFGVSALAVETYDNKPIQCNITGSVDYSSKNYRL